MPSPTNTERPVSPGLRAVLEFGPVLGFVLVYLVLRNEMLVVGGTEYTGFVIVTAAFMPIFLFAIGLLWYLTGRVARIQVATAVMLVVFGGLSVWLNDPRLFKMKPTAIYLALAIILSIGLLLGRSWLKYIMEDMIPLKKKGWMLLTKRMTFLFFASAAANELVWRTQSEAFWVIFETLVMPVVIFVFFLFQIRLFVDHASFGSSRRKS
ncbi:inner membrane-spanning protein YciB [Shimia ponticola]|uniref:inner membrane-spanning protein YciB n=1 Tax=Shimia ponticola TaxID=2582893 RepID=UPI0011BF9CC8|nr:septation protein IspZ [Shimia ponticola]